MRTTLTLSIIISKYCYQGTNFEEAVTATTPAEFIAAVTAIYNNIIATKPVERAKAIAREIARERPDLVGLQEADILRNGTAPASNVVSDQLQALLSELRRLGHHYEAIAILPGIDPEAPTTLRIRCADHLSHRHHRAENPPEEICG